MKTTCYFDTSKLNAANDDNLLNVVKELPTPCKAAIGRINDKQEQ